MAFLERNANRGSISTGFDINNSLKLNSAGSEYLYETRDASGSDWNRLKWTASMWVKHTPTENSATSPKERLFGAADEQSDFDIRFRGQPVGFRNNSDVDGVGELRTNALFRDYSAWMHIVAVWDTANGTAGNRMRLYINGEEVTSFSVDTQPSQNEKSIWGKKNDGTDGNVTHTIGAYYNFSNGFGQGLNGYLAEVHWVEGQALAPTEFGEFDDDSGIWKPKQVAVTYGTNGFYLKFEDSSNLGLDSSGNSHNWSLNNITAADQATDTPTNNFCILNPIAYNTTYTHTEGNTKWSKSDTTYGMASGTHYVGAGKWYWEIKATDFNTYSSCQFGIVDANKPNLGPSENGYEDPSLSADNPEILVMSGAPNNWVMNSNSTISNNGSTNSVDYTFNEGDIIAIALDMDNGGYWFGNSRYSGVANGSFWVAPGGTSTSGSVATTDPSNGNYALVGDGGGTNNGTPNFNGGSINGGSLLTAGFTLVTPTIGAYHSNTTVTLEVNFGGFTSYAEDGGYADANGHGNFAYAVPSGFYSLCSKNIAEFGGSG